MKIVIPAVIALALFSLVGACGKDSKKTADVSANTGQPNDQAGDQGDDEEDGAGDEGADDEQMLRSTISAASLKKLSGYYHMPMEYEDPSMNDLPVEERPFRAYLGISKGLVAMLVHCEGEGGSLVKVKAEVSSAIGEDSIEVMKGAEAGGEDCNASISKSSLKYELEGSELSIEGPAGEEPIVLQKVAAGDYAKLGLD